MCVRQCRALLPVREVRGVQGVREMREMQEVQEMQEMREVQEVQGPSPGGEDALEEGMTCSSFLAWRTPWSEEPGGLQLIGSQRVGHD